MSDCPYLPPRCPDCNAKMVFITVDMSDQGGPDARTWFCDNPSRRCGRVLESYEPLDNALVCVPGPSA